MTRSFGSIAIRTLQGACLAALVGFVFAPVRAEASCGDYVLVKGQMRRHHAMQPADGSAGSLDGERHDRHPSPSRPRCQGPSCSKGSFPPAPPAPTLTLTLDRWAWLETLSPVIETGSSPLLADAGLSLAEGPGLSILRPPR